MTEENHPVKVLVVSNDFPLCQVLQLGLCSLGNSITMTAKTQDALFTISRSRFDIILFDWDIAAEVDNIEVCQTFFEVYQIPVIALSQSDNKRRKVTTLSAGADDYVQKPFGLAELDARIKAICRRYDWSKPATPHLVLQVEDLVIDSAKRRVIVGRKAVHLTPKEYELLCLLASHPGQVFTHRMLLEAVWGTERHEEHFVRVFVNAIRRKLQKTSNKHYILTEPGIGYRFMAM